MGLFVLIFGLEAMLCNAVFQPSQSTDMEVVSILLLLVNVIIVFIIIITSKKDACDSKRINNVLCFSFFARLVVLFWDIYCRNIFILPNSEADAVWYHKGAVSYAFGRLSNTVDLNEYSYYVGQIYKLIGVQKITIEFLHVYMSIYSIYLIYKILCILDFGSEIRSKTITIICFLPNLMIVNTVFLQESVISFLLVLSFYFYTLWWKSNKLSYFVLSLIPSFAASFLHTGGIVCFVGFIVTYMFVGNKERKIRLSTGKILVGIIMVIGMVSVISMMGSSLFDKLGGTLSADSVTSHAGLTDRVSTADYNDIGIHGLPSSLDLIVNSPIRMVYFICSPLPWMWRGISDIIAFFGSALFYIYVVITSFKTIKIHSKCHYSDPLWSYFVVVLVVILIGAIMFGWGVSNTGTALRHREKFTYLYALLLAVSQMCMVKFREERKESIYNSSGI